MRNVLTFILILTLVAIACGSAAEEPPTLAPAAPPIPNSQPAEVTRIIDGDTIEVDINGQSYRVRYIGMDTPERGRPYFDEATEANRALVAGQTVYLVKDVSDTDRYGRLLRYVYLADGTFVNAQLVEDGYAQVASFPPDVAQIDYFLELQRAARDAQLGLWALEDQPAAAPYPAATSAPLTAATEPPPPPAGGQIVITAVDKEAEYVDLSNSSDQPIDLSGWVLLSERGDQACALGGVIQPGAVLRVWALSRDAGQGGYNCGHGRNIWSNSQSDPAALYDSTGALIDRYP